MLPEAPAWCGKWGQQASAQVLPDLQRKGLKSAKKRYG